MQTSDRIAGVDGCRAGWFVAFRDNARTGCFVAESASELAERLDGFDAVGIDIPIGLPERGNRECETLARRALSPRRTSSVFSAPIRPVLDIDDYRKACELRFRLEGKRMSKQSFFIMPKIADVDRLIRAQPRFGRRLHEVHPEVSFAALAGEPMQYAKRTQAGFDARRRLLDRVHNSRALDRALAAYPRNAVARDDVLDAFAVLWSAARIAGGSATRLPATPVYDEHGIDMAIWY